MVVMEGLPRTSMTETQHAQDIYVKHHLSAKGDRLMGMLKHLNDLAMKLCDLYNKTYCSHQRDKHLLFQCENSIEPTIASLKKGEVNLLHIEQIKQFVTFMGAYEIDSLIDEKYETCGLARKLKISSSFILKYCIRNFSDNTYVIDYNERTFAAQESTNILKEGENENISLDEEKNEVPME
jgi:hypothetical protein